MSENPGCPSGCGYTKAGDTDAEVWCFVDGPYTPIYTCPSTQPTQGNITIAIYWVLEFKHFNCCKYSCKYIISCKYVNRWKYKYSRCKLHHTWSTDYHRTCDNYRGSNNHRSCYHYRTSHNYRGLHHNWGCNNYRRSFNNNWASNNHSSFHHDWSLHHDRWLHHDCPGHNNRHVRDWLHPLRGSVLQG